MGRTLNMAPVSAFHHPEGHRDMEELQPLATESQVTRGTLTAQLCSTLEPTKNHECEEIQRAEPVLKPGPLEKQQVLITIKPTLQPFQPFSYLFEKGEYELIMMNILGLKR
ncbi:hypothetical protein H671_3g10450 [Cricetulus griseus]|uniref:Uncharacterized protein n=1 Tax=Cricetulus griseus TaxID=10029 RepID=A0A061IDJ2_CRIGR|nr:hypothetical protein H671_3g10450 [Cricetulus griseus]